VGSELTIVVGSELTIVVGSELTIVVGSKVVDGLCSQCLHSLHSFTDLDEHESDSEILEKYFVVAL